MNPYEITAAATCVRHFDYTPHGISLAFDAPADFNSDQRANAARHAASCLAAVCPDTPVRVVVLSGAKG